jgi:hypothetical protein
MKAEQALDRAGLRVPQPLTIASTVWVGFSVNWPSASGSAAVPRCSARIISPTPGMITPPVNCPAALTKSIVVAVPQTTTSTGRPSTIPRAPIIAAQRSEPSCAGLR